MIWRLPGCCICISIPVYFSLRVVQRQEAIEKAGDGHYDLILLDINFLIVKA
jgi:CheY-like chemotaxis protein